MSKSTKPKKRLEKMEMIDYENMTMSITRKGDIIVHIPFWNEPRITSTVLRLMGKQWITPEPIRESDIEGIKLHMWVMPTIIVFESTVRLTNGIRTKVYCPIHPPAEEIRSYYNHLATDFREAAT